MIGSKMPSIPFALLIAVSRLMIAQFFFVSTNSFSRISRLFGKIVSLSGSFREYSKGDHTVETSDVPDGLLGGSIGFLYGTPFELHSLHQI